MVQLALKDENFRLAYDLLSSYYEPELTFDDVVGKLREEKEKIQAERDKHLGYLKRKGLEEKDIEEIRVFIIFGHNHHEKIKEYIRGLLESRGLPDDLDYIVNNLIEEYNIYSRLVKINSLLEKLDDAEKAGRIGKLKETFNEIANLRLFRDNPTFDYIKNFGKFINFIERDHDPSELPLGHVINKLKLEPVNTMEVIRCLNSLVNDRLIDVIKINFSNYFSVFMYLLVHITKKGLNGREVIDEMDIYRWREFSESTPLELLGYLIIPLSFKKPTNIKMGLTLARLFLEQGRHNKTGYLEDLCIGLQNIEKYGTDEQVKKIISYAYFFGDLDAIIKLGALAKVEGSLEKAINRLRDGRRVLRSRNR